MARSRAKDYDDKRLSMLHRSAELFAASGYVGTSMNTIADACGVSKALLYHYYPDKEAILLDILSSHLAKLVAAVRKASAQAGDPVARFRTIVATLLELYRHADAEHQVQISSLKLLPKDKQQPLLASERILVGIMSDALAAAVPAAKHKRLLKPLTMSVFGMLNWHYMWFREGGPMTRAEYAGFVAQLVLAGADDAAAGATRPRGRAKSAGRGRQAELL
ncbi:AcrR family transcriptional regulator [Bradyrhizobium sp. USDA 4532]|uniref:TetR/AcrR family transcriptional regulator n=1 Tax=unclassified Bradyrhizobium TaxID=2631580 RepID=UPI00209F98C8|nr:MULTISPECIES: TetR/AcrR family transcriptional regulator [unclassified Bradyrhizobium]MCP1830450.1 AcrR family transcriptional regulator [Bradyrhizobium sp. USDA 4545]MCP1923559.1 AcrR family transcriptional regulator [Bradyrhizobium sp. USDA 4532]